MLVLRRSSILALILIISFVFLVQANSQNNQQDHSKLYSELVGKYELYLNERYVTLTVSLNEGILQASLDGAKDETLDVEDIAKLLFVSKKVEDQNKIQFIRNEDGKVLTCRLILSGTPHLAERKNNKPLQMHFSQKELQEDFQQLRKAIESMHPSKYVFTEKIAFDSLFDRQYGKITGDMSLEEFYGIATPVVATIGCGHARFNMPAGYWVHADAKIFPIGIRIIEGVAYVIDHYKGTQPIPKGSEVLSIDGTPIREIAEKIMLGISADGYNKAAKLRRLNSIFAVLFSVIYGNPEQFTVAYKDSGERKTATLTPVSIDDFPETNQQKPYLDFNVLADKNTAIITIKTFSYYREPEIFNSFIDNAFAEIKEKHIANVILDFRGNSGGDPFCTVPLLSYLAHEPVSYFDEVYEGYEKFAEPGPLAKNRFEGNLYTLIDAGCFSSTGHLSALMKYHKIGTFIGEETGGTYTCNDDSLRVELRNTRYRINMPNGVYAVAVKNMPRNRGVMPDHAVSPTVQDLINGKDTIMDYALALIDKGGN